MQYTEYYSEPKPNVYRLPIYVSVTSIYKNQERLCKTLLSLKNQTLRPNKIYVYLSREPYLLDDGFKNGITDELLFNELRNPIYQVVWTKNEGSYRKLLPILRQKWAENCVIITVDDDVMYTEGLVEELYFDFLDKGCSIGYRGFISDKPVTQYKNSLSRKKISEGLYNFATGKGAILYHPSFFHKTSKEIFDSNIYLSDNFKTKDDIWFYIMRIKNNINLYLGMFDWLSKDNTNYNLSLANNYNSIDANNKALILR